MIQTRRLRATAMRSITPAIPSVSVQYTASTDNIPNPERGFFYYTETHYNSDGSGYSPLAKNDLIVARAAGNTLVFRYFYIEKYLTQDTIDTSFLALVEADLQAIRDAGCKAIIRFSYSSDPTGMLTPPYNSDPPVARVESHIAQLAPSLNRFASTISSIEAGFIGYWGEWYYSDNFASDPSQPWILTDADWANRGRVLDALLRQLDPRMFILVRYVGIYQHFVASWDAATVARVGFHNDAFEASSDDYGTFTAFSSQSEYANKQYLATCTAHTPMGGESAAGNPPQSSWPNASFDLAKYHYTFLNPLYHPAVFEDWGPDNKLIAAKALGYRLRLISSDIASTVDADGYVSYTIHLQNEGYCAPLRQYTVSLIFWDGGTPVVRAVTCDTRAWQPGGPITFEGRVVAPPAIGTYSMYLHIADPNSDLATDPNYAVQFANAGIWNGSNGWNDLQQIFKVGDGGTLAVPGAPTTVTATPGDGSATLVFTAPTDYGGAAITSYIVQTTDGVQVAVGNTSPIIVRQLVNGTAYSFQVAAVNAVGTGAYSAASNSVTPIRTPAIVDDFSSSGLSNQWIGYGTYTVSGGQLHLTGDANYTTTLVSASTFDMTGRTAAIQGVSIPAYSSNEVFMQLYVDNNNYVAIGVSGPNLTCRVMKGGTATDASVNYDSTMHAWWRFRYDGTTLEWQTSPNNTAWTTIHSSPSGLPSLLNVSCRLVAGHYVASQLDFTADVDTVSVV